MTGSAVARTKQHGSTVIKSLALIGALALSVAVFGSVLVAGLVLRQGDRTDYFLRAYGHSEHTLKAAIDPRFQAKAEEIGRVLTRLVVIDAIKGAALFDASGNLQDVFGERTETSFQSFERIGSKVFTVADPRRAEFYMSPAVTGTPFHMLVRIDVGEMGGMEGIAEQRIMALAAVGAGIVAIATFAATWFGISLPIRRINKVMDRMVANPGLADTGGPVRAGVGELAALVSGVERFRSTLAELWRTKVLVADAILEQAPFAVVQIAPDGALTFGNPSAVAMFEREMTHQPADAAPIIVRDVDSGDRAVLREIVERNGGKPRLIEIETATATRYAVAAGLVVGAETRAPMLVAMLADATATHAARLGAEQAGAAMLSRNRLLVRRETELKLSLETSLALIDPGERGRDVNVDPSVFADEWLAVAVKAGLLAPDSIVHKDTPLVTGTKADVRAAIRLGMLLAYARCGHPPVTMDVEIKGLNFETVGVTIRATCPPDAPEEQLAADWQLAFAALRVIIKKLGGQMSEFAAGAERSATVKFGLRGAAERLSTGRKSA